MRGNLQHEATTSAVDLTTLFGFDPELAWHVDALCAQTAPDAFYPEKGESTAAAKRVCSACPVRTQCLTWALEHDEREGVWGGLSPRERHRLLKGAAA